jgi:alpha-D-xyloside xylohydrolase
MRINTQNKPNVGQSEFIGPPQDMFEAVVYPDSETQVPFMAYDTFVPTQVESVSLGYVERNGKPHRCLFSFHSSHNEKFVGTGERFSRMNLAGKTFVLENTDALGVNNRRAYKNVPFYISSRGYGMLALTSAHIRLSLADISTRAAQGLIEDDKLDLFIIGGGGVEQIVHNYRKLTGFPADVPLWSYGMWMSRMTYLSADQVQAVGKKLRDGKYPCDVLHIDTGWFEKDWVCDWKFGKQNFPEPEKFLKEMKEEGFRITLWQMPYLYEGNKLIETAKENNYLILHRKPKNETASDFTDDRLVGAIDFSNPEAVEWYKGMLKELLGKGVAAIKTDFGESVPAEGSSHSIPLNLLHNLYGLLYQKAASEITKDITGDSIIWARTGWIGCQRYPVHWGGDAASTWDGLAASIRGGLHFGCSGFAFWSHDIPGFHGLPNFMNSKIDDELYVRWTQVGVFSSHMRYHGTLAREPYHFPEVADIVRKWLRLRYCLIPYLLEQGKKCTRSGYPILRALIFHHSDDTVCWNIDDQYYFGDNIIVAPVLNSTGIRDVYLPEGSWTDLWTGEVIKGSRMLKKVKSDLSRIPIYAKSGATIKVYPEDVQCTDQMDLSKSVNLVFDSSYAGISKSILGDVVKFS